MGDLVHESRMSSLQSAYLAVAVLCFLVAPNVITNPPSQPSQPPLSSVPQARAGLFPRDPLVGNQSQAPHTSSSSPSSSPQQSAERTALESTVRSDAAPVNPFRLYSTEPAPMGIADYGVNPSGASYRYNTSQVLGNVSFGSLLAWENVSSHLLPVVAFQLNANLVVRNGSRTLDYWVQDVFGLSYMNETSDDVGATQFLDSAYNDTTGDFPAGSIRGHGTVGGGAGNQYYEYGPPNSSTPGNAIPIYAPVSVLLKMVSSTVQGVPEVAFEYSDGYGGQTYDVLQFPGVANWTDEGFVVDGTQYTTLRGSYSEFYDLELILGGPRGGSIASVNSSNINMSLQFWNGNNFQSVLNAYDFGSDTAETAQNVTMASTNLSAGGTPGAHMGAGPGTLKSLYSRGGIAILNVSSPLLTNGTLGLGNQPIPFVGGDVNLTLAPGSYHLALRNGSLVLATRTVSVVAGEYLALVLPQPSLLWFNETGLPNRATWQVQVNHATLRSASASLSTTLFNGSYSYSITPIAGYHTPTYSGLVQVAGPTEVTIIWIEFKYAVVGSESGLPVGSTWSISVNGTTYQTANVSLVVDFPNGTFGYTVGGPPGYAPLSKSGNFSVYAVPAGFSVEFIEESGYLAGTLSPVNAMLTIDGTPNSVGPNGQFNSTLQPGDYFVNATLSGYKPFSLMVTIAPGLTTKIAIALTKFPNSQNSSGGLSSSTYVLVGVGTAVLAVAVLAAAIMLRRRNA